MDLFQQAADERLQKEAPLADRMRPRTLDDFVGQEDIVGPGRLLRRAIEKGRLQSAIFYGPPGSGKTTLARIIATTTNDNFVQLNAVTSGVGDIRRVIEEAEEERRLYGRRTILFIDEIHRFNRAQQDALLPAVEAGKVILIGSTTENPYFEVNAPLVSRSRVFRFSKLTETDITAIMKRALTDTERGLGSYPAEVAPEALAHLARVANGDARNALNALELAVLTTPPGEDGVRLITLETAVESIQQPALQYDKSGDNHYDTVSAFIKSMRGSDPDAALYWFARMIHAGEDPRFIVRRIIVHASEDVGLADPTAMLAAHAAANALEWLGMPEARIPIAQAILHISLAPKSNSVVKAIDAAMEAVTRYPLDPVPVHLRDASYKGAARLGHGKGYLYPHDYPGNYVEQQYLPDNLVGKRFYEPGD